MPHTVFRNEIQHQHKAKLLSPRQIEEKDLQMDWAFRKAKGPATVEDTQVVLYMREMVADPGDWEAFDFPDKLREKRKKIPDAREQTLAACQQWLEGVGVSCAGHPERGY